MKKLNLCYIAHSYESINNNKDTRKYTNINNYNNKVKLWEYLLI
jgi:hypothetical protein